MTRILVAAEPLTGRTEDGTRLRAWHEALVRAEVVAPDEELEAADHEADGGPGRIIIAVREQLDHLNSRYCRAVLALETFDGFESFVDEAVASGHFDLEDELGHLFAAPGADVVAIPYSLAHPEQPTPGPVLVTAVRLLHKRLSRVRLTRGEDAASDQRAAEHVRQHATEHGWDETTYWGWSDERAAEAIERFESGNAEFAGRAWGTAWPDPPEHRGQTKLDLAGCRPDIVSDVLTTIRQAVYGASDPQA